MQTVPHNLITVKETAEYLNIPLPTVYYLVQRGQLPAVQIGGRWRVKKDLLDREVLRKEEEGTQPSVLVVDDDEGLQAMFSFSSRSKVSPGSSSAPDAKHLPPWKSRNSISASLIFNCPTSRAMKFTEWQSSRIQTCPS